MYSDEEFDGDGTYDVDGSVAVASCRDVGDVFEV